LLPDIGPKAAAAIIAGLPYAKVEDVDRVDGIGPKKMEAIRPPLTNGRFRRSVLRARQSSARFSDLPLPIAKMIQP